MHLPSHHRGLAIAHPLRGRALRNLVPALRQLREGGALGLPLQVQVERAQQPLLLLRVPLHAHVGLHHHQRVAPDLFCYGGLGLVGW